MIKWFKNIGPGALVTAAFIGPGTVTLCSISGVNFGFKLLWALTLSVIATIVLQGMSAKVGIITQKGLALVIKEQISSPILRKIALILIFSAIVIGNTAYEAGNITGASIGINEVFKFTTINIYPFLIGIIAFIVLWIGNYKILEKILIGLVLLMSFSFLITAIITKPSISAILQGMFIPSIPQNSILIIIGLIGTTVVPYNLFLHASLVSEKWKNSSDLKYAQKDTLISIILGGIVSMSIIITAASINSTNIQSVKDLTAGLLPLYGVYAKYFLGIGMFAAGITSAITAPLAASFVANNCFGWNGGLKSFKFRSVWFVILITGVLFSSLELNPIEVIKFAQIANGILLPVVALFLLWIVNKSSVLGVYRNTKFQNVVSTIVIFITLVLGFKSVLKVLELL